MRKQTFIERWKQSKFKLNSDNLRSWFNCSYGCLIYFARLMGVSLCLKVFYRMTTSLTMGLNLA